MNHEDVLFFSIFFFSLAGSLGSGIVFRCRQGVRHFGGILGGDVVKINSFSMLLFLLLAPNFCGLR